ncbi:sulfuric ester hydrolase [Aureococcus anophagefferens]|nr:sulfuric ester hydrolase [Aureococcus anophagefferens]
MPHVLHVVLDDVGWDDLWESRDLPPAVVSPTIFRLAKEGVKLTSYYGQSYCSASVSSRASYATHGVGKWNVGHCATEYLPWKRGFDTFLGYFSDGIHYTTHAVDEFGGGVISADDDAVDEAHTLADLVYYDGDDASFRWDRGLDFLGEHDGRLREALQRLSGGGDRQRRLPCARYLGGSNAPLRGAKFDFMEGALRLPALLYSPTLLSTVARGRYNHLFHHVDWLATRILFSVSATGLVVRDGDYKLIREYGDSGWFEPDLDASGFSREDAKRVCFEGDEPQTFLFNVRDDPEERASVVEALPDVAARLAAYGDDAYRDEFFHFPLERAWIFHELDDEEAVRLRATWIDTSDDDVYRFIAPWGCMLVFDDGSTAPGGAGVRFEDTRGPG